MKALYLSYFPELSPMQLEKLDRLEQMIREWNAQINVISRKDEANIAVRHILHSLGLAKVVQIQKGSSVVDIGTGGGLPGLPMAILFPEASFMLVDSIRKKTGVVRDMARQLDLDNVHVENDRVENLRDTFDYAISRAVAPCKKLLGWVNGLMNTDYQGLVTGGLYFLKGGDLREEIREAGLPCKQYPLSDFFEGPFFETKAVVHFKRTRSYAS